MIGGTTSKSLDLTIIKKDDTVYTTQQIKVEIGLNLGSSVEYILVGLFNIDDVEKTDYTIKFTCFDNMIKFEAPYFSNLGATATLQQVVNELSVMTGVQFTGSLPTYNVKKLEGFTCREVLGYVASLCGGNAIITRDGKFTIVYPKDVSYSITGANYIDYKREDVKYKIGKLACQVGEKILEKGSLGTDSMELDFENPWVTTTILNDLYTKLNGFEYLGYSMKWQGDVGLDLGDIITCTDIKGVTRKLPILSQKFSFTGGLTSEIGAKGETQNKNSFSSSGSNTNKVNRLVTEVLIVNEALINKANIKDLEAVSIRTQTLEVKTATIENAIIKFATIEQLNVTNGYIQNLTAENAKINTALINKADIVQLNAISGKINVLESDTANINTLLSKFITGESGQFLNLTSSNVVIANAVIKDAMIDTISANKINAGSINTNLVTIQGTSGNLLIKDNTIQIKDSTRVRVQIGKDASNDYSMYVWDATGKLMFDAMGLKSDGIKSKIIRDDMVSDTANISGSKLNISSVISSINGDNTTTLKSSKILLDGVGQSLEIAFNSLKSNVDSKESRNYLKNGNALTNKYFTALKIEEIEGKRCFCQTHKGSGERFITSTRYNLEELAGKIVTISFLAKQTSNLNQSEVFILSRKKGSIKDWDYSPNLKFTYSIEKLTQYKFNFKFPIDIDSFYIRWDNNGSSDGLDATLWITDIKLELGENPNPVYSIAPEDIEEKIETNTTAITVEQGRINGLISENTIIKGDVITLNNNYVSLNATVNGINTTVASHTTSISTINTNVANTNSLADSKAKVFTSTPTIPYKVGDLWVQGTSGEVMKCKVARATGSYTASDWEKASKYTDDTKANAVEGSLNILSGTVTTVQNKQTSLEQNLDGFKTTVSSTYATKTDLTITNGNVTSVTNRVATAESSITQLNNQIKLKVEANDITSAVNGIQFGGRNLLLGTKDFSCGKTGGVIVDETYKEFSVLYGDNSKGVGTIDCAKWIDSIVTKANTEYTLSFYAKGTGKIYSYFYPDNVLNGYSSEGVKTTASDGSTINSLTTDWKKYWIVWKTKSTANGNKNVIPMRLDIGTIGYICGVKFEEGNKATDWTPAIEDVDNYISTVDERVTTTNNKVATIEINLSGITQKVSSTESTISTHTTQLGTVDGRINTAKTSAINTASSDASTKANNAKSGAVSDAKSYTDGQITTVNSTINSKVAEIKTTTDSISSRVASTESSITTINGNVTSLATRMSSAEQKITSSAIISTVQSTINTAKTEAIASANTNTTNQLKSYSTTTQMNTAITQSANSVKTEVSNTYLNKTDAVNTYATKASMELTSNQFKLDFSSSGGYNLIRDSNLINNDKFYWWYPSNGIIYSARTNGFGFYTPINTEISIYQTITVKPYTNYVFSGVLIAEGATKGARLLAELPQENRYGLFSEIVPAGSEKRVNMTITTGNSTELRIAVKHLGSQNHNAGYVIWIKELLVTTGTLLLPWSPHPDEIYSGNTVIDKDGVKIKNGALTVLNNNNVEVVKADNLGNLTIRGALEQYSTTGLKSIDIKNNTINVYDWQRDGDLVGGLTATINTGDSRGSVMIYADKGNPLKLGYYTTVDRTGIVNFMAFDDTTQFNGNLTRIGVYEKMGLMGTQMYFTGTNKTLAVGKIGAGGDNHTWVTGRQNVGSVIIGEITDASGTATGLAKFMTSGLVVYGDISCTGTKHRVVDTKYGDVAINAYETAEALFGDVGEGIIGEDELCYIYLDPILLSTINTKCSYQVFLQKYGVGELYVAERAENHFIVKGTANLKFAWELKAHQKGYETTRLEIREKIKEELSFENVENEDYLGGNGQDYYINYEKEMLEIE